MSTAIELSGYSFAYAGAAAPVLRDVSFALDEGSFTVLAGLTGSGKSTLLRAMKPEVAVAGETSGTIRIMGDDPAMLDARESARRVGFVMQDPQNQLVADTVWHELAFGLENIGTERLEMRRRVAETAHFFGIGGWFDRKVADLSGGQKQLLNLAAVVVMQPSVLVLDEPTSQLDPIAAKSFFDVLGRVNEELGITVVIIEHRLEDVLPMADHVLFLRDGALAFDGSPQEFVAWLDELGDGFSQALPAATQIAQLVGKCDDSIGSAADGVAMRGAGDALGGAADGAGYAETADASATAVGTAAAGDAQTARWPFTVREGRMFLGEHEATCRQLSVAGATVHHEPRTPGTVVLRTSDLWFRYSKEDPFVLRGVDFEVRAGQLSALVGGNASGKSTLLSALAGIRKPERGSVRKAKGTKIALLAQDPKTLFVCDTLLDDLMEWSEYGGYGLEEVHEMMERMALTGYEDRHPYDLSGGETQKAALAKVLLLDPDVLLLDEPVKGIDVAAKALIADMLAELADAGKAVLFTAHDLDFVAQTADECSMMFGCDITCTQECRGFFRDNLFYSTATSRITRGYLDGATTVDDVREFVDAASGVMPGACATSAVTCDAGAAVAVQEAQPATAALEPAATSAVEAPPVPESSASAAEPQGREVWRR